MANDLLKQFMSEANEAQENVQKKALQKAVQTTSSPTTSGKSKLDKKKKQQNKKATGAGVKTSAVGADTLNAAKDIAKTQEKKLPTKRNGSGKASVQKQETAKKVLQHLKEVSKPIVKTAENYDANPYTKEKTDAMWNRMATGDTASDKFGRVYAGVGQGVVDANLAIPNLIGKLATGKDVNLQERTGLNIDNEALKETAGFKGGKFAGEMIGYGMQNMAAAPAINGILANTKLGQMAAKSGTKMATNTRIGKLVGEEAAKDFTTGLARNAVEAGTVGLAQNIGIANQEGRTGLDLAGNVLLNTAADLTFGGLMEGVGLGVNAVKGAKALRKATGEITEGVQTKTLPAGEEVPANAEKVAPKSAENATEVAKSKGLPVAETEAKTTRKPPRATERKDISQAREDLMQAEMKYEFSGDDAMEGEIDILANRLEAAENRRLDRGVDGRKLKSNGVPEVHEKVNDFDVESSDLGFVSPEIRNVADIVNNSRGIYDAFYMNFVSGQKEIERLAREAGSTRVDDYTQAFRNRAGTIRYIFSEGLVDSAGRRVNDVSFRRLVERVPREARDDFNTYAQHLHNIDRIREGHPIFAGVTEADSRQIVADMLRQHPEFTQYTQDINNWWEQFIQTWLVDTGRIDQASFDEMRRIYPNYIPTYREGFNVGSESGTLRRQNAGSGIRGLRGTEGSERNVLPFEDNFLAQIERIVSSTKKNDLLDSIIAELEANPNGLRDYGVLTENRDIIQQRDIDLALDLMDQNRLQEVRNGMYLITAYRDGQPVCAYVNQDMARAIKLLDDAYGSVYSRYFAGAGKVISDPMKAGITGYNPLFALSNAFRDLPTLFIQSQHGVLRTTTGLGRAIHQMATDSDLWETYKALGGKQSGYYAQGSGFRRNVRNQQGIPALWEGVKNFLSLLGEGTETIPRFAEFINSVDRYGNDKDGVMRALKDAGEVTVNFSRSAPVTKTMDAWVLYLNAAVQGLDKFGRTLRHAPVRTLGRSAAMISMPYVALMVANWDNPHYQDLNERTKQNYFCIPNVFGEKDSQGNCMTFIKVPLNREYGALFGSSLDMLYDYMHGEEDFQKGMKETVLNNFAPPNPLEDNILSPFQDLKQNEDFAGRAIVPQSLEAASPINQHDGTTSGAAKWIAGKTNAIDDRFKYINLPDALKSPKKLDFLIDSYGGYIGQELQAATSAEAKDVSSLGKETITEPLVSRFTADPRYSSGVVSDFYDAKDAAETAKVDSKLAGNEFSEAHARYKVYTGIADQLSDLSAEERAIKNNKSLSKNQKTEKINALRAKKNELARGAEAKANAAVKEYKQSPTYSALNEKIKEKYDSKSGLNKETFGKAYNAQKDLDTTAAKSLALLDSGVKTLAQAQGINSKVTETSFERAKVLKNAKISAAQFETAAKKINSNKDSYYSVEEITSYLNTRNDLNNLQKRAIFAALSNSKNNPY